MFPNIDEPVFVLEALFWPKAPPPVLVEPNNEGVAVCVWVLLLPKTPPPVAAGCCWLFDPKRFPPAGVVVFVAVPNIDDIVEKE